MGNGFTYLISNRYIYKDRQTQIGMVKPKLSTGKGNTGIYQISNNSYCFCIEGKKVTKKEYTKYVEDLK